MKILTMLLLLCMVGIISYSFAYAEEEVAQDVHPIEIAKVVASPSNYQGRKIVVEGRVKDFRHWTLFTPGVYTVFELVDSQGNVMNVYTKGERDIKKGDWLRVSGRYSEKKSFFIFKFKNVVKVEDLVLLSDGYDLDHGLRGTSCVHDPWVLSTC